MIKAIRRVLGLETVNEKLSTLTDIDSRLAEISVEIGDLAQEYTRRSESKNSVIKSIDSQDILEELNKRFDLFEKSHLETLLPLKREKDSLEYEKLSLLKSEEISEKYEFNKKYQVFKSRYKSGIISKEIFNTFLKAKHDGKTLYSDILVFNKEGKLLILQRAATDDSNPQKWGLPGGHVDPNESHQYAATRELVEETGLYLPELDFVWSFNDKDVHIEYFRADNVCEKEYPIILQADEHTDYKWIDIEDVERYPMPFNMAENIKKALGLENKEIVKSEQDDLKTFLEPFLKAYKSGEINETVLSNVIKARTGKYADTAENRRLKRVGQEYGSKKQGEQDTSKDKKQEEPTKDKQGSGDLANDARNASVAQLEAAIKESPNEEVRQAAHNELSRREKEEKPQSEENKKFGEDYGKEIPPKKETKESDKPSVDPETKPSKQKSDEKDKAVSDSDKEVTDLTGKWVKASEVETGKPIKIGFTHNTDKSPVKYKSLGQEIEPHGKYMLNNPGKDKIEGWEYGEIEFKNPLVVENINTGVNGWKGELFNKFGKKGKQLSKELIKRGYDAIITVDSNYNDLSEIVSLKDFDPNHKDKRKMVKSEEETLTHEISGKINKETLNGGKADNLTIEDIAKKHNVEIDKIKKQLQMGIVVEMEHTNDPKQAIEISLDHLTESSEYYTKLAKMESTFDKDAKEKKDAE